MATIIKKQKDVTDPTKFYMEYSGSSSETKPEPAYMKNGSLFLELDTGDVYYYDGSDWSTVGANS